MHLYSFSSLALTTSRRQDESLDEIEQHVNRISRMGRAIGEEMNAQVRSACTVVPICDIVGFDLHIAFSQPLQGKLSRRVCLNVNLTWTGCSSLLSSPGTGGPFGRVRTRYGHHPVASEGHSEKNAGECCFYFSAAGNMQAFALGMTANIHENCSAGSVFFNRKGFTVSNVSIISLVQPIFARLC